MDSLNDDISSICQVSPFRNLRITAYVRLPEAFRSLSRLSSALSAKASALRPYLLNPLQSMSFNMIYFVVLAFAVLLYMHSVACKFDWSTIFESFLTCLNTFVFSLSLLGFFWLIHNRFATHQSVDVCLSVFGFQGTDDIRIGCPDRFSSVIRSCYLRNNFSSRMK